MECTDTIRRHRKASWKGLHTTTLNILITQHYLLGSMRLVLPEDRVTKPSKLLSIREYLKARFLRALEVIPDKAKDITNACVSVSGFLFVCF